jgi:hypothetical protein
MKLCDKGPQFPKVQPTEGQNFDLENYDAS